MMKALSILREGGNIFDMNRIMCRKQFIGCKRVEGGFAICLRRLHGVGLAIRLAIELTYQIIIECNVIHFWR